MDILNLLTKEHIITDINSAIGRDDAIRSLIKTLENDKVLTDPEDFLAAVKKREAEISTQTRDGIALPHACSQAVRKLGFAVGVINPPGITYDEESPDKCRVLFLMAIPAGAPDAHLQLLAAIANFIHARGKLDKLLNAKDPAAVLKLFATRPKK